MDKMMTQLNSSLLLNTVLGNTRLIVPMEQQSSRNLIKFNEIYFSIEIPALKTTGTPRLSKFQALLGG
jgi:hypothetical protein